MTSMYWSAGYDGVKLARPVPTWVAVEVEMVGLAVGLGAVVAAEEG